jgi:hypothetical protein
MLEIILPPHVLVESINVTIIPTLTTTYSSLAVHKTGIAHHRWYLFQFL